ncbi:hypothetical protein DFH06DRAFT_1127579 [Mycena polygramma]|nr:hypothetical protein DFH06DRAFT_1127579 [Mycena polygramma]
MSASILETTLIHGDIEFLENFFWSWDPPAIFVLGRLNYRLRALVYYYASTVWNVPRFLRRWFERPLTVLRFLDSAPAILCGVAVLQYFDRAAPSDSRLEICVDFGGLVSVKKFLAGEGYYYRPEGTRDIKDFDVVTLVESARFPESRLSVTGDRSTSQEEHRSRSFKFVQTLRGVNRARCHRIVIVHLVRCELRRFVFATHSTAFMNFISGSHAISLFPRSTFVDRSTFVSCQEMVPSTDTPMMEIHRWLDHYSRTNRPLKVIGTSEDVHSTAEHGPRTVGDDRCWPADPLTVRPPVDGPAFDSLTWRAGVTRHGSFLRVGEPFVWSYVFVAHAVVVIRSSFEMSIRAAIRSTIFSSLPEMKGKHTDAVLLAEYAYDVLEIFYATPMLNINRQFYLPHAQIGPVPPPA